MQIVVTFLVILLDQVSKLLVRSHMTEMESIPIIGNIFHLTYVMNTGAAFSMLPNQTLTFIIITCLAVVISLFFYYRVDRKRVLLRLGIALEVGGAVGNLIDRIRFGSVVDFIDFRIWPVFNLADFTIVVGVALICWELLKHDSRGRSNE